MFLIWHSCLALLSLSWPSRVDTSPIGLKKKTLSKKIQYFVWDFFSFHSILFKNTYSPAENGRDVLLVYFHPWILWDNSELLCWQIIFNAFNATLCSCLVDLLDNSYLLDCRKYMHSMFAFGIQHCNVSG